jgi:hypothetical protein
VAYAAIATPAMAPLLKLFPPFDDDADAGATVGTACGIDVVGLAGLDSVFCVFTAPPSFGPGVGLPPAPVCGGNSVA